MQKKIFLSIFVTCVFVSLCVNAFLLFIFDYRLKVQAFNELKSHAQSLLPLKMPLILAQDYPYRVSVIASDGTVLFDSTSALVTQNHSDRMEVKEALELGFSKVVRHSTTLQDDLLYYALRTPLQESVVVLRISTSISSLRALMLDFLPLVCLEVCLLLIASAFVARILTQKIIAPLQNDNLEHILKNSPYSELSPFITRIKHQREVIKNQLKGLKRRQNQMLLLTQNMSDGLMLLDKNGNILLFNKRVKAYFDEIDSISNVDSLKHYDFLRHILAFLDKCHKKQAKTKHLPNLLKNTEVLFIPIYTKQKYKGVIIILRDFSAKQRAQALRKEFSVNVTHELKTPLTSILASIEMINNNLVAPKDLPNFTATIQKEASYLLMMVDEVLKLSFLDESERIPKVRLNLKPIIERVFERLTMSANSMSVQLSGVLDEDCVIMGNAKLIENLIYNVCDNAIKYNRANGNVSVGLYNKEKKIVLCVKDTGVGIKDSQQKRVFERFYRANRGYSKGSGLGLAIVKSIARLHNANIRLQSKEGVGSEIAITFNPATKIAIP